MKIALVHEFLTQFGGAERVLQNFMEIWPDADLHVLVHSPNKIDHVFDKYKIKTSFINRLPGVHSDHKWYLPLMPLGAQSFDFKGYDVVLTDSSSFAKGIKRGKYLHINYCHTPTRFLWSESREYLKSTKYPFFIKWLAIPILRLLKEWDYKAAQRPQYIIANSKNVQERIKKYYNRDAEVIPPPVDTEFFRPTGEKNDYYFAASRLEPYKNIDLVIKAFNELGWPLKVAGSGTAEEYLKSIAKPNIEFLGRVSDEQLRQHYSASKAFIFAAEEDAGIMVLEAQSCGTPVIAFAKGGSLETVVPNKTGLFFNDQTSQSLIEVLKTFDASKFNASEIRLHAQDYDKKTFQSRIVHFIEDKRQQYGKTISTDKIA